MSLQEMFRKVLALQASYSASKSVEMDERGRLIWDEIPEALREAQISLATSAGLDLQDLKIEGRDHTGRKSHVPWVRVASRSFSPLATDGWYVVFLFRFDGSGVYLALECGATEFQAVSYVARDRAYLSKKIEWARKLLNQFSDQQPRLETKIELASETDLAKSYERSTVFAYFYGAQGIPSDNKIIDDLESLMRPLGRLYEAELLGQVAGAESPEVRDAVVKIEAIARPQKKRGQGFGLSANERKVVENRAVAVAQEFLADNGYHVLAYVGNTESFDILAERGGVEYKVEVKGTTGGLGSVFLTANEVALHQMHHPANALLVVHGISLSKGIEPVATGGMLHPVIPWKVEDSKLRALSFAYDL